ncbi:hypothetical protein [Alteromonas sp. C1M14]|uniref:hypothetical protein n=1 Tax=Alteromonas sp. C1M14 TaxID=2841567 RepID=UPI001C087405|nr:hypothetical protein [Alteromonas sp. C1M14]MBU2978224.1 hypothetical protein [Alteromonas sp. C1M14]
MDQRLWQQFLQQKIRQPKRLNWCPLLLLWLPVTWGASGNNEFKETVAFAGITFQSGKKALPVRFPFSSSIVKSEKLNRHLYQAILKKPPQNFTLTASILDKDEGYKYAATLLLDSETVSTEQLMIDHTPWFTWWVQLSAQLLIFDVESSQLVFTHTLPVIRCKDIDEAPPTEAMIRQRVSDMLANNVCGKPEHLLAHFVDYLHTAPPPGKSNLTQFAVSSVVVEEKANAFIPEKFKADDMAVFKRYVANQLTKAMAETQGIAVQPYNADLSVLTMQGRFSGGEQTYNLILPKPYYKVDYTVRGFKKVPFSKNSAGEANYYVAFSRITVNKNLERGDELIFSQPLQFGQAIPSSSGSSGFAEWVFFEEQLLSLIYKTNTDIYSDTTAFFKMQGFQRKQKRGFLKQFEALKEAYKSCRL